MLRFPVITIASFLAIFASCGHAQIAGSTTLDVGAARFEAIAIGWSSKRQILGCSVYNENGQKVGKVDDLIVAPDSSVSFAIIGAGGFVGLRRHQIALPVELLALREDGELVLEGASKQAVRSLPPFDYAKRASGPAYGSPGFVR